MNCTRSPKNILGMSNWSSYYQTENLSPSSTRQWSTCHVCVYVIREDFLGMIMQNIGYVRVDNLSGVQVRVHTVWIGPPGSSLVYF